MRISWMVFATTLFLGFSACKYNPQGSSSAQADDVQINPDVSDGLTAMPGKPCEGTHLFFLVASAEDTGKTTRWDISSSSRAEDDAAREEKAKLFSEANDKAEKGLIESLSQDPGCKTGESMDVVLVTVVDGQGMNDSVIRSHFYHYAEGSGFSLDRFWSKETTIEWTYSKAGGLKKKGNSGAFELNVPASIEALARAFATNSPATYKTSQALTAKSTTYYAHITYIIKAHGGRMAINKSLLPDATLYDAQAEANIKDQDVEPVLLFDLHGEEGEVTSSLYSAYWGKETVKGATQRSLAGESGNPTAGESGNPTAGENGNPTAGENGNPTAGEPANQTAGEPGNQTAGERGVYTAGDVGNPTAGASKSVLFSTKVVSENDEVIKIKPEAVRVLGEAASFKDLSGIADGVHKISLPVGKGIKVPNLLILDSCYGHKKALDAFPSDARISMVANPNPIFFQFMDYKSMSLTNYMKLPGVIMKFSNQLSILSAEEAALKKKMAEGLLPYTVGTAEESKYRVLQFWTK